MPFSALSVELTESDNVDQLVRLLYDAWPNEQKVREIISQPEVSAYIVLIGRKVVGAVIIRWGQISEIDLIAVSDKMRGRGYGRSIIKALVSMAKSRHVKRLLVGTSSMSVGNILFYQKCGFRLCAVRRDFFGPFKPPMIDRGIPLRDMIVFDYELDE